MMIKHTRSRGDASPTSPALHHSGEEMSMERNLDGIYTQEEWAELSDNSTSIHISDAVGTTIHMLADGAVVATQNIERCEIHGDVPSECDCVAVIHSAETLEAAKEDPFLSYQAMKNALEDCIARIESLPIGESEGVQVRQVMYARKALAMAEGKEI